MRRFWRGLGRRAAALLARLGLLQPGKIMYIGGSGTLPTPLTREEEAQVIARLEQGDEEARQTLIERNLRLVVYIARRFENTGVNLEDLISIGTIGLIKAVGTYQPAKSIKLATYASRCIENEILMYLRKIAAQKSELSFDEPLNTDWDGCSSPTCWAPRATWSCGPSRRTWTGSCCARPWSGWSPGRNRSSPCASAWTAGRSAPRRRWPTSWASPSPTSPGWRSGSSPG